MKKQSDGRNKSAFGRLAEQLNSQPVRQLLIAVTALVLIIAAVFAIYHHVSSGSDETEKDLPEVDITELHQSAIPDMQSSYSEERGYIGLDGLADDPLGTVSELDEYKRSLRIIQSYGGVSDSESMEITRSGGCIKAESDSRVITKNGNRMFVDFGTHTALCDADDTVFFTEVGITSIEMLRNMCGDAERYECTLSLSEDKRYITADVNDMTAGILMNFEIDVESGIIVTERFYSEGALYRFVFTEKFTKSADADENFFDIIEE